MQENYDAEVRQYLEQVGFTHPQNMPLPVSQAECTYPPLPYAPEPASNVLLATVCLAQFVRS